MTLISRARYERDMAALRAEAERLRGERNAARVERDAFKTAATTAARQFTAADAQRQDLVDAEQRREALAVVTGRVLIEGGRTGRDIPLTVLAAREKDRARALDERLIVLQAAVMRCTCGGAA